MYAIARDGLKDAIAHCVVTMGLAAFPRKREVMSILDLMCLKRERCSRADVFGYDNHIVIGIESNQSTVGKRHLRISTCGPIQFGSTVSARRSSCLGGIGTIAKRRQYRVPLCAGPNTVPKASVSGSHLGRCARWQCDLMYSDAYVVTG